MATEICGPVSVNMNSEEVPTWYENDLKLAAALGIKLLEANRELEETIRAHEATIQEQAYDIMYISERHSEILQNVNNVHNQALEQLESTIQELEGEKSRLYCEKNESNEKIHTLRENVEFWQQQCQELQEKIEFLANKRAVITCHPEDIQDVAQSDEEDSVAVTQRLPVRVEEVIYETEQANSQTEDLVKELKTQFKQERRRCENLELEVAQLSKEKNILEEQLTALRREFRVEKNLNSEIEEQRLKSRWCPTCNSNSVLEHGRRKSIENEFEEEDPSIESRVFVRLENGAQAYGSQESLYSIGHAVDTKEITTSLPTLVKRPSLLNELIDCSGVEEILGGINSPVADPIPVSVEKSTTDRDAMTVGNSSFYFDVSSFVSFTESSPKVVEVSAAPEENKISKSLECELQLEPLENPFKNHFRKMPEYKSIFQEIFMVLKRKVGGFSLPSQDEMIPLDSL